MSEEEKDKIKEYQRQKYQQLIQYKINEFFFLSIRMSEKALKFDNIRLNKKEFHKSKQPINLDIVNVDQ